MCVGPPTTRRSTSPGTLPASWTGRTSTSGPRTVGERVGDGVSVAVHGFVDDERFHGFSIGSARTGRIGEPPHRSRGIPRMPRRGAGPYRRRVPTAAATAPPCLRPSEPRACLALRAHARAPRRADGWASRAPPHDRRAAERRAAANAGPVRAHRRRPDPRGLRRQARPEPPAWWRNLEADPAVTVQIGADVGPRTRDHRRRGRAARRSGRGCASAIRQLERVQRRAGRELPLVRLVDPAADPQTRSVLHPDGERAARAVGSEAL